MLRRVLLPRWCALSPVRPRLLLTRRRSSVGGAAGPPPGASALLDLNQQLRDMLTAPGGANDLASSMISNAGRSDRPWEASCIEVIKAPATACAPSRERAVDDGDWIVLYYETATEDGLAAFRAVASRVAAGELPGETENRASIGFAMWRVPAKKFFTLVSGFQLK